MGDRVALFCLKFINFIFCARVVDLIKDCWNFAIKLTCLMYVLISFFQLLTRFMKAFDHSIPNTVLTNMHTVRDAVDFFQEDVILTNRLEDLTKLDLPKNLHIKLEYQRFDPETDTMFGGKNPLPGSNAIVNSIKYRRKYKSIITKEDKPGYINHYYGY